MAKVKYYAKENSSIGTFSLSQMTKAKLVSALDPSPTARSRLTFELSRQTGLRRTPSSARLSTRSTSGRFYKA